LSPSPSLWYPYTPLSDLSENPPLKISRAEGLYLYDEKGKPYLDGIASWWCCLHGHRHPKIVAALEDQLEKMIHISLAGLSHENIEKLSDALLEMAPGFDKVFYSDNGSTAVEVALKICMQFWQMNGEKQRRILLGFEGAYHGDTLATMAVGGAEHFHHYYSPWFPQHHLLPSPSKGEGCLESLEIFLKQQSEFCVALVLEPLLQAAGGMLTCEKEILREIMKICRRFSLPLILDEVATGFGRTGSLFAYEQAASGIPDLLCLSKGLTGGTLPLSATLVKKDLVEAFVDREQQEDRTFYHGHTYTGNALASAAALASVSLCQEKSFLPHLKDLAQTVAVELEEFSRYDFFKTRQVGPVGVVEVKTEWRRPLLPVYRGLLDRGVYLRPLGNLFYFWPPLTISPEEMRKLMAVTRESLLKHFSEKV
jgi:adenosylmethionine-8-amino-7-oxononanoate aminotransferase